METRFVGTWLLVSQHTVFADGASVPSRGENPVGVIMYDAVGNMAVQLMRTDEYAGDYTDLRDLRTAMSGYHAYFGRYEVDEAAHVVRHHVVGSAYPPYRGTTQVRAYTFVDDTLTLKAQSPDQDATRVLVWRRSA